MILYHVPHGSTYLEIVRVKFSGSDYIKAHVRWYFKPSMTYMCDERNLKIPNKAIKTWEKLSLVEENKEVRK